MMPTRLRPLLLLLALYCTSLQLLAQSWQADWGTDTHPTAPTWRYDLRHFVVGQAGELSLAAPQHGARQVQSILATSVSLPEAVRYRGQVRLDEPTTKLNHCYILLACYAQDRAANNYDYVALSVGGGERRNISLVSLRLHPTDSHELKRFELSRERVLIEAPTYSTQRAIHLSYDIRCSTEGYWEMLLRHTDRPSSSADARQRSSEALPISDRQNSTGILCLSTSRYSSSMHFKSLRIDPMTDDEPADPPTEIPKPGQPTTPRGTSLLLTEIMASPEAGGEEYIELHNPSNTACSLEGYSLLVGKHPEAVKAYPLDALGSMPAGAYWALTTSPSAIRSSHPNAQAASIQAYKLPRLTNTGCYIALYETQAGILDDVLYKPSLKQRGVQSRRGVALERISLSNRARHPDNSANWTSALKSAGYATPTQPNSRLGTPTDQDDSSSSKGQTRVARLYELVQQLRSSPTTETTLLLHDLLGQCLVEMQGAEALQWLETLSTHAPSALESLPTLHRGIIVLQLIVRQSSKQEQTYSLTLLRP